VVKRGMRTSGGVSAGLPGIYFAEILGFATLRPSTATARPREIDPQRSAWVASPSAAKL